MVTEPDFAMATVCGTAPNAVGWPGGFGGWWSADARNGSILIFLAHNIVEPDQFVKGVGLGVYDAIARFHAEAAD